MKIFLPLALTLALSCATLKPCVPATPQATADVLTILDNPTLSNVESVAALEASGVAFCVITALAKDAIKATTGVKLAASGSNPRVVHSQAWLAAHP